LQQDHRGGKQMQTQILKQLRLSRHFSQEQLADMSGLNVRTIKRIESGQKASVESMKCIAAALDIDIETFYQETVMIDKSSDNWKALPIFLKCWFVINFLQFRPTRESANRVIVTSHIIGFLSEPALAGGLILLATGYLFHFLKWQGDKYGIWYDTGSN
jgi:transcriptional regulator with XRE-family HTH domain